MGLFVGYAQGSRVDNWSYLCRIVCGCLESAAVEVPEVILHVTGERLLHEEGLLHVKYEIE